MFGRLSLVALLVCCTSAEHMSFSEYCIKVVIMALCAVAVASVLWCLALPSQFNRHYGPDEALLRQDIYSKNLYTVRACYFVRAACACSIALFLD